MNIPVTKRETILSSTLFQSQDYHVCHVQVTKLCLPEKKQETSLDPRLLK